MFDPHNRKAIEEESTHGEEKLWRTKVIMVKKTCISNTLYELLSFVNRESIETHVQHFTQHVYVAVSYRKLDGLVVINYQ